MKRLFAMFESLRVARRFAPELREERWSFVRIALLSVLVITFDILRPWPIKWIVDEALAPEGAPRFDPNHVILAGAAAAVLVVTAKAISQYFREIGLGRTEHQFTRQLRFKLFSHLATLSPGFHAQNKSGDLLVRLMGDVPMVSTMLVNSFLEVATRAVFILVTVVVMLWMDLRLTLATFLLAPIILILIRTISSRIHVAVRKQRRKEGDLADYLHEAIAATETIQSIGGSKEVVRRFARSNRRTARAGLKAKILAAKLSASVETVLGIGLAIVVAYGSFRVLHSGSMTTGDLLVFISYVRTLSKPIRSASKHANKIAKGTACGERLIAILDATPEVVEAPDAIEPAEQPDSLAFEDVTYTYGGASQAMRHFTAEFKRGQLSALVGRSGAGKSTAAALAMRLMDPEKGRVTLGGTPLPRLKLDALRKRIGLCLQRTLLFGESIRENLILASPDAGEEDLWEALEEAGAAGFIRELEEGLDTELGASGVGLSGGQLSRLSLARTLLRKADVLIMDEPFAGLDRIATKRLSETIRRLATEKVVIVIAHDFENIDQYDHIVFLDRGHAVDAGSHHELVQRLPMYRTVVRTSGEAGL